MKVNWVIDDYILESRSTVGDLKKAITDAGHNLHVTKYVPFADDQDYGPAEWVNEPTVLYGTHGFLRKCKIPFIPGAYGLTNNTSCNIYYSYVPLDWFLNKDFVILPFAVIRENIQRVFDIVDDNKFFLRPVSGFKTFAGMVITDENHVRELHASQQITSVTPETLCVVSVVKELKAEFRFVVADGKVIDGSEYRWDNVLDVRHDYDYDCLQLATAMAEYAWQPDRAYTCDVALTPEGPKIIELNSFACAGLYACDKNIIVDKISELAWKDFHE